MELPHIGLACSVCNRNDYLPFKCTSCAKIVCIDHRANHGAECPLNKSSFSVDPNSAVGESLKQACDFCRKITLKLELSKCPQCPGNYCLYHRHQAQHKCPAIARDKQERDRANEVKLAQRQEALDRLKALHPEPKGQQPPITSDRSLSSLDPKKRALARRVRLMKMKQSASCPKGLVHDTSIQTDQDRLYLEVKFLHEPEVQMSPASQDGKSVNIWTSPKWTVGQTLDYPAHLLGLINRNHIDGSAHLIMRKCSPSSADVLEDLDCKATFQKYLDAGELESGDVVYLTYAPPAPH